MTVVFTNGSVGRLKNKKPKGFKRVKAGPITLGYITLGLICAVSIFYLLILMSAQAEGYKIQQLNDEVKKLSDDQKVLELEVAKSRSLQGVTEREDIKELNMVPVQSVSYIATSPAVASR